MKISELKAIIEAEVRATLDRVARADGVSVAVDFDPEQRAVRHRIDVCRGEAAWHFDLTNNHTFTV